jgi:hypothetical protein
MLDWHGTHSLFIRNALPLKVRCLYTKSSFFEAARHCTLLEAPPLVAQGGFLPVYLNPINFEAEQQKAALQPESEKNPI